MKKKILILTFLSLLFCQSAKAQGFIFTHVTQPVSATAVPSSQWCSLKEGHASSINIMYLFEFGDAGVDTAAREGCIKQIYVVNKEKTSFLMLFEKVTTVVYGN